MDLILTQNVSCILSVFDLMSSQIFFGKIDISYLCSLCVAQKELKRPHSQRRLQISSQFSSGMRSANSARRFESKGHKYNFNGKMNV